MLHIDCEDIIVVIIRGVIGGLSIFLLEFLITTDMLALVCLIYFVLTHLFMFIHRLL